MATEASLLRHPRQRQVQNKLLQYHVAGSIARGLAQVELRNWTPSRLDSILSKVHDPACKIHEFARHLNTSQETSQQLGPWVQPPSSEIERAAKEKLALCINTAGEFSLRSSNYIAISHVWEEGIRADYENRGLPKQTLEWIFTQLRPLDAPWIWLDCLAIPGGNKTLTAGQEIVKKDIINNLASIYRNADAVVVFDAMLIRLRSRELIDVGVVLLCGKWMTRVWTLQEICLATNGLLLTALGTVRFIDLVRALRYLSGDVDHIEGLLGPHDVSISQMVHDVPDDSKFESAYLRFARLVLAKDQRPSLTALALSCCHRQTGNDIDYARAFFPLLKLEWNVHFTREQGMKEIYESQKYFAKRLVLMHGSPRSAFRPGWAPSYLTGLSGPIISPNDPLGDIEWMKRGLQKKWYTYKISRQQPSSNPNVLILYDETIDNNIFEIACLLDGRESKQSRECFRNAIAKRQAFLLSNQEIRFPSADGLAIVVLLVERDDEAARANEAWVCFTAEAACMDGATGFPEVHSWLLLHESPISDLDLSGKASTRISRMIDYTSSQQSDDAPLLSAIQKKDLSEFQRLLQAGANLDVKDERGCTPLHMIVLTGQVSMLECLVSHNVDINAKDHAGRTALNLAAEQGDQQIVEKLLASDADPNLHPHDEIGTLNQAIIKSNHKIIKLLIENGAEVDKKDTWGWYPLFHACRDHVSVSMLLEAGADPNTDLIGGSQLIHFAARAGQIEVIKMLLDRGVEVDRREGLKDNDYQQPTALYRAVEEQHEETVKLLLAHGADPNLAFENCWTCILLGASIGNFRILQLMLVNSHAHVHRFKDLCNPERWTALHLAAKGGHRICAKLLLEAGWDYTATDAQGRTPAALAQEVGQREAAEMIRDFHLRIISDATR